MSTGGGDGILERVERVVTYVILGLLILGGLLAEFIKPIGSVLDVQGALVLLASVLLVVFRLIDRHLQTLGPALDSANFSTAIARVGSNRGPVDVQIFANDGTKYYFMLGDTKMHIGKLSLLLIDTGDADKWERLVERGVVARLEVRRTSPQPPTIHYLTVSDGRSMFGLFTHHPRLATGKCLCTDGRSVGRGLTEALWTHFEDEWEHSEPCIAGLTDTADGEASPDGSSAREA